MARIAVTELEYDKATDAFASAARTGWECIRAPSGEAKLAEIVRKQGIRYVIVGVERYSGAIYDALPAGGVIARFGIGHDGIDKDLATERRLLCTNTPGVLDDSVAEHAVALIIAAARHIPAVADATRRGGWTPVVGRELRGKTIAVIGCGPIGRRVARITSLGLGMEVRGCEVRDVDMEQMRRDFGFAEVVKEFAAAAADADFVSLHIPAGPATRRFINHERLCLLAKRAWLVNTARGAVVDEEALFEALSQGQLAGAALDVFENEPYKPAVPGKDLRTLDNVIMTPHVGSSTREACQRMAQRALQNIILAEERRFGEMDLLNRPVLAS